MIFEKPLVCKIKTGSPYAKECGKCFGYVDIKGTRYAIILLDNGTEPGTWNITGVLFQHTEWVDAQQVLNSL